MTTPHVITYNAVRIQDRSPHVGGTATGVTVPVVRSRSRTVAGRVHSQVVTLAKTVPPPLPETAGLVNVPEQVQARLRTRDRLEQIGAARAAW